MYNNNRKYENKKEAINIIIFLITKIKIQLLVKFPNIIVKNQSNIQLGTIKYLKLDYKKSILD